MVAIDPTKEYKPKEIFENKFILNQSGNPDYRYILNLIEKNQLKARNIATGSQNYYLVLGSDIIKWRNSTINIERK